MLLELNNGDIILKDNSIENLNSAKIYLNFKDLTLRHSDSVKLYFNEVEQFRVANETFRINATSLLGRKVNVSVVVYRQDSTTITYQKVMELEQYFSLGKQAYEKLPQVLIDINKRFEELSNRIKELEKESNVI